MRDGIFLHISAKQFYITTNPRLLKTEESLASLIHLADYMTQRLNIGAFEWDNDYVLDENIIDILGFGSFQYLEDFISGYEHLFKSHLESINQ